MPAAKSPSILDIAIGFFYFCRFFTEYPFICQPVLYYDFDKICAGEIFDESGLGNNGMSRGRVVVEAGYNGDNGLDLSDGFIQLDGLNFKVCTDVYHFFCASAKPFAFVRGPLSMKCLHLNFVEKCIFFYLMLIVFKRSYWEF